MPTQTQSPELRQELLEAGYSEEQINEYLNSEQYKADEQVYEPATPATTPTVDITDDEIEELRVAGYTDEQISEYTGRDIKADALRKPVGVEADVKESDPEILEYIRNDEHRKEARGIFEKEGFDGVIKFLQEKSQEDEAYEESLKNVKHPVLGLLGFSKEDVKNVSDAWDNFRLQIDSAYPNLHLAYGRITRSLFGEETIDEYLKDLGPDSIFGTNLYKEDQLDNLRKLELIKNQYKDTAEIVASARRGDFNETITGIATAPLSFAATLVNMAKTGGVSLFTDMFTEAYTAVNESRAEEKGITLQELVDRGEDSVAAPTAAGAVMTALERIGLGAVGRYILKSTPRGTLRNLTDWLLANTVEGTTELLQHGVVEAATAWEETDGDAAKSAEAFLSGITSAEGAENFAMGFFASGGSTLVAKPIKGAVTKAVGNNRKNADEIKNIHGQIAYLKDVLVSDNTLDEETRKSIQRTINELEATGTEAVKEGYRPFVNLSKEDYNKINKHYDDIQERKRRIEEINANESLDEETKRTQRQSLDREISYLTQEIAFIQKRADERKKEQDKKAVEQAGKAVNDPTDGKSVQVAKQKEKERQEQEEQEAYNDPIGEINKTAPAADDLVRLQLEVRNIEDDNTLSREEKEKKIERLERLYHYKHGKVDIEAPPQKKPLKNVNKVFNPHEILDPKDPFITNIIAPIEKFFGDKVNIQFLPGKKKGAYGIVKKVDGKVTIQFTTGRGKETGVKLDTLIHEPGHILYQLAENSKDPQLQAIVGRIKELIVNTEDYADIKRLSKDPNISYSKLSEEGIIQEAFARYFGKHGAKRVRNQGALQSAIAKLLKYVKDKFGVDLNPQKLNLENISDIFLADLLSGEPTLFNLEGDAVNQAFEQAQDTAFEDAYIEKQAGKLQEQRQAQLRDDNRGFWGKAQTNIYNEYILPLKKKKTKDIDKQLESVKTKIKRKTDKGQPVTKFLQNKQKDLLRQRNVIRNQFDNQWYKRKQFLDLIEQEIDRLTTRESVKTKPTSVENKIAELKKQIKEKQQSKFKKDKAIIPDLENQITVLEVLKQAGKKPDKGTLLRYKYAADIQERMLQDNYKGREWMPYLNESLGEIVTEYTDQGFNVSGPKILADRTINEISNDPTGLNSAVSKRIGREILTDEFFNRKYPKLTNEQRGELRYLMGDFLIDTFINTGIYDLVEGIEDKGAPVLKIKRKKDWYAMRDSKETPTYRKPVKKGEEVVAPGIHQTHEKFKMSKKANQTLEDAESEEATINQKLWGEYLKDYKNNKTLWYDKKVRPQSEVDVREDFIEGLISEIKKLGGSPYTLRYFFHPHGRFSPETIFVNFQNEKLVRSLEQFNRGEVLTEQGYDNILVDVYTAVTNSKATYAERLTEAKKNKSEYLSWLNNPAKLEEEMTKAKDAYALRAGLVALSEATNEDGSFKKGVVSEYGIALDAKNSALQHWTGLTGSQAIADKIDLGPQTANPNDGYDNMTVNITSVVNEKTSDQRTATQKRADKKAFNKVNKEVEQKITKFYRDTLGEKATGFSYQQKKTGEGLTGKQKKELFKVIRKYLKDNNDEVTQATFEFLRQNEVRQELREMAKLGTVPKIYGGGYRVLSEAIFDGYKGFTGKFSSLTLAYTDVIGKLINEGFEKTYPEAVKGKGLIDLAMKKLIEQNEPAVVDGIINNFTSVLDKRNPKTKQYETTYSGTNTRIGRTDRKTRVKNNKITIGDQPTMSAKKNMKAISAIIIQGLDGQLAAWMVERAKEKGYPIKQVYDAFITTPNHAQTMKLDYQEGLVHIYENMDITNVLNQLLKPLNISSKQLIEEYNNNKKLQALENKVERLRPGKIKEIMKSGKDISTYETLSKVSNIELTPKQIENTIYKKGKWNPKQTLNNERNFEDTDGDITTPDDGVRETRPIDELSNRPLTKQEQRKYLRNVHQLLNLNLANYKSISPFKKSKITQDARDTLRDMRREFAAKDSWTYNEYIDFAVKVANVYRGGRLAQQDKFKAIEEERVKIKKASAEGVKIATGIDLDDLNVTKVKQEWKKNRGLINQLKAKGPLGIVADVFTFLGLDDFLGLSIRTLARKGKGRETQLKHMEEFLVNPLKEGEYVHNELQANLLGNYKGLKDKTGIKERFLGKHSGIEVEGEPKSNNEIVMLYNYIKDPRLHNQLIQGGVTYQKMREIIQYVKSNPNFKEFADGYPSIFEVFTGVINKKMDEHGRPGVTNAAIPSREDANSFEDINKDKVNVDESYNILDEIYDNNVPATAPYLPFLGKGEKDYLSIEVENQELEKAGLGGTKNFYSVMSGNLRSRTYTGSVDTGGKTLAWMVDMYAEGPLRTVAMLDFARNVTAYYNSDALQGFEAKLGPEWRRNITHSIKRIVTGRPDFQSKSPFIQGVHRWLSRSIGAVMFINVRSAITQLVSIPNFSFDNPINYARYMGSVDKNLASLKLIKKSGFFKVRGLGRTDVILDQLFTQQTDSAIGKAIDKLGQDGYFLTKGADRLAIALGGAPYLSWRLDFHKEQNPTWTQEQIEEAAMIDFVAKANEAQQSVNQSRLGRAQTESISRYFLTFLNSPIQFNRKIAKSLREIQAGNNLAGNWWNVFSIMTLQIAGFSFLQRMMVNALFGDDEDEEADKKKIDGFLYGLLQSTIKSTGLQGVALSVIVEGVSKKEKIFYKDKKTGEFKVPYGAYQTLLETLVNSAPAVSAKARLAKKTLTKPYKQSEGFLTEDEFVTRLASFIEISGIPTARVLKILGSVNDLGAEDLDTIEKMMRLGGWSRYDLQQSLGKFK